MKFVEQEVWIQKLRIYYLRDEIVSRTDPVNVFSVFGIEVLTSVIQ